MSGAPPPWLSSYLKLICWTSEESLFWNSRLPKLQIWSHGWRMPRVSTDSACSTGLSEKSRGNMGGGRDMGLFPSTGQKKIIGKSDRGHTHTTSYMYAWLHLYLIITYHLCKHLQNLVEWNSWKSLDNSLKNSSLVNDENKCVWSQIHIRIWVPGEKGQPTDPVSLKDTFLSACRHSLPHLPLGNHPFSQLQWRR